MSRSESDPSTSETPRVEPASATSTGDVEEPLTNEVEMVTDDEPSGFADTVEVAIPGPGDRAVVLGPFLLQLVGLLLPVAVGVSVAWWLVRDLPNEQLMDRGGTMLSSGVAATLVADEIAAQLDILETLASQGSVPDAVATKNGLYRGSNDVIRQIITGVDQQWQEAFAAAAAPPRPVADTDGSRALRTFRNRFPVFESLLAVDRYGAATASTEVTPKFDYSSADWFQSVMAGGQVQVASQFVGNEPRLAFAVPMLGSVGRPAGVLFGLVDSSVLVAQAVEPLEAEDFEVLVIGASSELLFRSSVGDRLAPIDGSLLQFVANESGSSVSRRIELADGRSVIASAAALPRVRSAEVGGALGWKTLVVRQLSTLDGLVAAQREQRQQILTAVGACAVAASLSLAWLLTRLPRRLARVARALDRGDYDQRIAGPGISSGTARSFNDLIETAAASEARLHRHRTLVADAGEICAQAEAFAGGDHLTVFSARKRSLEPLAAALRAVRDRLSEQLVEVEERVTSAYALDEQYQADVRWGEGGEAELRRGNKVRTEANSVASELKQLSLDVERLGEQLKSRVVGLRSHSAQTTRETIDQLGVARERQRASAEEMSQAKQATAAVVEGLATLRELSDRVAVLALNGSIQAALTGKSGRAFGVIASEIEQLSRQSVDLLNRAQRSLGNLGDGVAEGSRCLDDLAQAIDDSKASFDHCNQAIEDLLEAGEEAAEEVGAIADRTRSSSQSVSAMRVDLERQCDALVGWKTGAEDAVAQRQEISEALRSLRATVQEMRGRRNERGLSLVPESAVEPPEDRRDGALAR